MNQIDEAVKREANRIGDAQMVIAALARLRDVPGIAQVMAWRGWDFSGGPRRVRVCLALTRDAKAREAVKALLKASGAKRADKKFDADKGVVVYSILTDDVEIDLSAGAPERCEVERVEEEVEVPEEIKPAHTEKRVVYRLKDPACLEGGVRMVPLTEAVAAQTEGEEVSA